MNSNPYLHLVTSLTLLGLSSSHVHGSRPRLLCLRLRHRVIMPSPTANTGYGEHARHLFDEMIDRAAIFRSSDHSQINRLFYARDWVGLKSAHKVFDSMPERWNSDIFTERGLLSDSRSLMGTFHVYTRKIIV